MHTRAQAQKRDVDMQTRGVTPVHTAACAIETVSNLGRVGGPSSFKKTTDTHHRMCKTPVNPINLYRPNLSLPQANLSLVSGKNTRRHAHESTSTEKGRRYADHGRKNSPCTNMTSPPGKKGKPTCTHRGRTVRCARAVRALCEKLAVLHHREFGKFRRLKGRH